MQYSKIEGVVRWSGGMTTLKMDQSIEDDHPLLAERPDLFTPDEPKASISTPARVQTGMQRPGEVRSERVTPRPTVVKAPPRQS